MNWIDLNGLKAGEDDWWDFGPVPDGNHAEKALRLYLQLLFPEGQISKGLPVPGSGPKKGTGQPDIVLDPGNRQPVQIFEVKAYPTYGPWGPQHGKAKAQLQRYVDGYNERLQIPAIHGVDERVLLAAEALRIPSSQYTDRMIAFVVYDSAPGMIFWRYVDIPEREFDFINHPAGVLLAILTTAAVMTAILDRCRDGFGDEQLTPQPALRPALSEDLLPERRPWISENQWADVSNEIVRILPPVGAEKPTLWDDVRGITGLVREGWRRLWD